MAVYTYNNTYMHFNKYNIDRKYNNSFFYNITLNDVPNI